MRIYDSQLQSVIIFPLFYELQNHGSYYEVDFSAIQLSTQDEFSRAMFITASQDFLKQLKMAQNNLCLYVHFLNLHF